MGTIRFGNNVTFQSSNLKSRIENLKQREDVDTKALLDQHPKDDVRFGACNTTAHHD